MFRSESCSFFRSFALSYSLSFALFLHSLQAESMLIAYDFVQKM